MLHSTNDIRKNTKMNSAWQTISVDKQLLLCSMVPITLQWRHNDRDGVSNHQPHDCLLNRLFGSRWKNTSKLWVTGLCEGNSPVTGEFAAQRASNAENVTIWWRHNEYMAQHARIELLFQDTDISIFVTNIPSARGSNTFFSVGSSRAARLQWLVQHN